MFRIKKPKGAKLAKKSKTASASSPAKEEQQQPSTSTSTVAQTDDDHEQHKVRFTAYLSRLSDVDQALYHGDSWTISDQGSFNSLINYNLKN